MNEIQKNLETVQIHMRQAAQRVGRDPRTIRLVAATKFVSVDRVQQALECGLTTCGEIVGRKPRRKMGMLGEREGLVWHFLGRLQRRKIKHMVGRFALIHSVESCEQAEELNFRAKERGIQQSVLLEINVGGEESKGGFLPEEFLAMIARLDDLPHVSIQGLMTVPPKVLHPDDARPYFQNLKRLADTVKARNPQRIRMDELSMGMSQDYEIAIEEGATYVRIGTAIFGDRRTGIEPIP